MAFIQTAEKNISSGYTDEKFQSFFKKYQDAETIFDHWKDKKHYDFFNAKGDIDGILDCLNLNSHDYFEVQKRFFRGKSITY